MPAAELQTDKTSSEAKNIESRKNKNTKTLPRRAKRPSRTPTLDKNSKPTLTAPPKTQLSLIPSTKRIEKLANTSNSDNPSIIETVLTSSPAICSFAPSIVSTPATRATVTLSSPNILKRKIFSKADLSPSTAKISKLPMESVDDTTVYRRSLRKRCLESTAAPCMKTVSTTSSSTSSNDFDGGAKIAKLQAPPKPPSKKKAMPKVDKMEENVDTVPAPHIASNIKMSPIVGIPFKKRTIPSKFPRKTPVKEQITPLDTKKLKLDLVSDETTSLGGSPQASTLKSKEQNSSVVTPSTLSSPSKIIVSTPSDSTIAELIKDLTGSDGDDEGNWNGNESQSKGVANVATANGNGNGKERKTTKEMVSPGKRDNKEANNFSAINVSAAGTSQKNKRQQKLENNQANTKIKTKSFNKSLYTLSTSSSFLSTTTDLKRTTEPDAIEPPKKILKIAEVVKNVKPKTASISKMYKNSNQPQQRAVRSGMIKAPPPEKCDIEDPLKLPSSESKQVKQQHPRVVNKMPAISAKIVKASNVNLVDSKCFKVTEDKIISTLAGTSSTTNSKTACVENEDLKGLKEPEKESSSPKMSTKLISQKSLKNIKNSNQDEEPPRDDAAPTKNHNVTMPMPTPTPTTITSATETTETLVTAGTSESIQLSTRQPPLSFFEWNSQERHKKTKATETQLMEDRATPKTTTKSPKVVVQNRNEETFASSSKEEKDKRSEVASLKTTKGKIEIASSTAMPTTTIATAAINSSDHSLLFTNKSKSTPEHKLKTSTEDNEKQSPTLSISERNVSSENRVSTSAIARNAAEHNNECELQLPSNESTTISPDSKIPQALDFDNLIPKTKTAIPLSDERKPTSVKQKKYNTDADNSKQATAGKQNLQLQLQTRSRSNTPNIISMDESGAISEKEFKKPTIPGNRGNTEKSYQNTPLDTIKPITIINTSCSSVKNYDPTSNQGQSIKAVSNDEKFAITHRLKKFKARKCCVRLNRRAISKYLSAMKETKIVQVKMPSRATRNKNQKNIFATAVDSTVLQTITTTTATPSQSSGRIRSRRSRKQNFNTLMEERDIKNFNKTLRSHSKSVTPTTSQRSESSLGDSESVVSFSGCNEVITNQLSQIHQQQTIEIGDNDSSELAPPPQTEKRTLRKGVRKQQHEKEFTIADALTAANKTVEPPRKTTTIATATTIMAASKQPTSSIAASISDAVVKKEIDDAPAVTTMSSLPSSTTTQSSATDAPIRCGIRSIVSTAAADSASFGVPTIPLDSNGTRLYSFLHPARYNASHKLVQLDYCCPNLTGTMQAIDPTRIHTQIQAGIRELPAAIVMTTEMITRKDLEANPNKYPAFIRQKVEKMTNRASNDGPSVTTKTAATVSRVAISASLQSQLPIVTTTAATTTTTTTTQIASKLNIPTGSTITTAALPSTGAITSTLKTQTVAKDLRSSLRKLDAALRKHASRLLSMRLIDRLHTIENLAQQSSLDARDVDMATNIIESFLNAMPGDSNQPIRTSGKETKPVNEDKTIVPEQTTNVQMPIYDTDNRIIGFQLKPIPTSIIAGTSAAAAAAATPIIIAQASIANDSRKPPAATGATKTIPLKSRKIANKAINLSSSSSLPALDKVTIKSTTPMTSKSKQSRTSLPDLTLMSDSVPAKDTKHRATQSKAIESRFLKRTETAAKMAKKVNVITPATTTTSSATAQVITLNRATTQSTMVHNSTIRNTASRPIKIITTQGGKVQSVRTLENPTTSTPHAFSGVNAGAVAGVSKQKPSLTSVVQLTPLRIIPNIADTRQSKTAEKTPDMIFFNTEQQLEIEESILPDNDTAKQTEIKREDPDDEAEESNFIG